MLEKPAFIQGLYCYEGAGLGKPIPFQPRVTYLVPRDKRSQVIYFRAGNAAGEMVYLALMRRGALMRYFPIGAKRLRCMCLWPWWRICHPRPKSRF